MSKLFIDGQAGTTGLQITARLRARDDLELLSLSDSDRKNPQHRAACLNEADIAILCLPDEAARQAVELADGRTRILDASTAFRTDPDWAYGLPELNSGQRQRIADAQFVSNPGCYPQGFILLVRPLIEAGVLSPEIPLSCHATSGYSGGGRQMIEDQQSWSTARADSHNSQMYGLTLAHKHVPEMHLYSQTNVAPVFSPTVSHYYKGMLVNIPLHTSQLSSVATIESITQTLQAAYAGEQFINVIAGESLEQIQAEAFLSPTHCNDTNNIELMVFGNADQVLLTARYDNLGKGAAGAAVQNLNIMLGIEESRGLIEHTLANS